MVDNVIAQFNYSFTGPTCVYLGTHGKEEVAHVPNILKSLASSNKKSPMYTNL